MHCRTAVAFFALFYGLLCCQTLLTAKQQVEKYSQQIDAIADELIHKTQAPGVSIAVGSNSQLIFSKGFGLADVENDVPVTELTRFRTASIAKSLTAVLVLSLEERGAIDLDASIQTYLPDFPEKEWPVTCRNLLGHLGGIRHYRSSAESSSTEQFDSVSDGLRVFAEDPLRHQPGSKFLYSSFGYNLLGAVAEQAGTSKGTETFMELLHRHVLEPAGMTHTVEDNQSAIISARSRGYMKRRVDKITQNAAENQGAFSTIQNAPLHNTSMKIPGGGLLSTPSDLVRFASALNTGRLLRPDTCQKMWTRQTKLDGSKSSYGLGWKISQHHGRKMVSHSGGQAGTSTLLVLFPESGTSVAIMCNLQNVALTATARRIADLFLPQQIQKPDYNIALSRLRSAIDHELVTHQLPALSIGLVDGDQVVWSQGFGFQDEEKNVPATSATRYRFPGFSHLISSVAVMKSVDRGLLRLDEPLSDFLPSWNPVDPTARELTLRQLLSHRSGLILEPPIGNRYDLAIPTLDESLKQLQAVPLIHRPGTRIKLSRASLLLVHAALEVALRKANPLIIQEEVLDALNMNQSSYSSDSKVDSLALGWSRTFDGRSFKVANPQSDIGHPEHFVSTVDDMAKFLSWIIRQSESEDRDLLTSSSFQEMANPMSSVLGVQSGFGLGFQVQDFEGYSAIGLGDSNSGYSAQLLAIPEMRLGVVVATPLDCQIGTISRIAEYALRLVLAQLEGANLPDYPTTNQVPLDRAHALVGHFQMQDSDRWAQISLVSGKLYLRHGNFQREIRSSSSDGSLVIDNAVGLAATLTQDATGNIQINNEAYHRVADVVPEEIAFHWKGLVGEYGPDHRVLYILEEAGKLTALVDWSNYYPLRPLDQDTFQFPDSGLHQGEKLIFHRDSEGRATEVVLSGIRLQRRNVEPELGSTFKIEPIRPLEELRAVAQLATPPQESRDFRKPELQELITLDSTFKLDIRYATENNFTGSVFYNQPRAFLQLPAARAVVRVQNALKPSGLGLLIHDAYRPWYVTKMFWEATPKVLRNFVANPSRGSRHNRGCAVDLSLFDLATGKPISMVSGYDEFTQRAYAMYPGGTSRQRYYRDLLRHLMEREGFSVYEDEWWHFDYHLWQDYPVQNAAFESLSDISSDNPEVVFEYAETANGRLSLADGFHGIWYMNQPSKDEYVYKYSGGMATYPWQHHPVAIYSPKAHKTFFVYGGRYSTRNTLLHCVSYFDHATGMVARPRILLDKKTNDAHDNPVLCIDNQGHVLIFSSAHGTTRPAYIHRSRRPYDIDEFDCVATTNYSYPQPWNLAEQGLLLLHTRYKGGRVLHAMNSPDGMNWSEPRALAHIDEGHYQVSQVYGNRIATAFNFHPQGKGLNHRTNVYYMESSDAGHTWSNVHGQELSVPLIEVDNPALVADFASKGQLCYMRCVRFTSQGQPVILFVKSGGYQSGPQNDPRQFMTAHWTGTEWEIRQAMKCDNNYDFADLEIREDGIWQISGATQEGPQAYNTGGEIAIWHSHDEGASWQFVKQLTMQSTYNHNFPRKPENAHRDFYLLWADGHARQLSDSVLYFTDRDGTAIWKLPTKISGEDRMVRPARFEVGDVLR